MKTDLGVVLTEYFGDGEYENRRAEIVKYTNKIRVNMFDGSELKEHLDFEGKAMYYIEDVAENWVIGVKN
jgi:hypothetical protein